MKKSLLVFAFSFLPALCFTEVILYDSEGFEKFAHGNVDGQFGFTSTDAATAYTIVADPTFEGRGNVLRVNDPGRVLARLTLPDASGNKQKPVTETMYQHIYFSAYVGDGQFSILVRATGGQLFQIWLDNGLNNDLSIQSRIMYESDANTTQVLKNTSGYQPGDRKWHEFEVITKYTDDTRTQREFSFYINGERMDTDPSSTFYTTWTAFTGEISYLEFNQLTSSTRNTYIDDLKIVYNNDPNPTPLQEPDPEPELGP